MTFSWDKRKNELNRRKHGVSFETAVLVFDDPLQLSTLERIVEGEARWQTIGMVHGIQLLLVAHTAEIHSGEEVIRIISARAATRRERRIYAEGE